jgi:Viral coat protein P2 N-terminal domain
MSIKHIQLNPFNNVVATGVANLDLANLLGFGIKKIYLNYTGMTLAMMTSIQLKVNGKIIVDTSGTRLNARNAYRGLNVAAGLLTLDFTENQFFTKLGYLSGVLDTTLGIKSIRLEITIAGATAPTLFGFALVGDPQVSDEFRGLRPLIARIHSSQQTIGASGFVPISVPHMASVEGGSIFKRIAVFSAQMAGLRLQRNGVTEYEVSKAQNDLMQLDYKRTPQAGLFMIDACLERLQEDVFDTRPASGTSTVQLQGNFTAGETIVVEVETLEPLDVY